MKITPEIAEKLRAIDLSSKGEIIARYKELASSPLFVRTTFENRTENLLTIHPKGTKIEAVKAETERNLHHYAANRRGRIHSETLSEIKKRLGILFAKWEKLYTEKVASGSLEEGEGMGFIWDYAAQQGLSDFEGKRTKTLTDKDRRALDLTAEKILSTFERYLLFSLTTAPDFEEFVSGRSMGEEAQREINILFADEWDETAEGLTSSFEEEVQFFADEAYRYVLRFLSSFSLFGVEYFKGLVNAPIERERDTSEEDEADLQNARESRYKDYITE